MNLLVLKKCIILIQVRGLPSQNGVLYRTKIEDLFKACHEKPRVHIEDCRYSITLNSGCPFCIGVATLEGFQFFLLQITNKHMYMYWFYCYSISSLLCTIYCIKGKKNDYRFTGFPLFSKYQIPGFLKVFGPKFQVFSSFFVFVFFSKFQVLSYKC